MIPPAMYASAAASAANGTATHPRPRPWAAAINLLPSLVTLPDLIRDDHRARKVALHIRCGTSDVVEPRGRMHQELVMRDVPRIGTCHSKHHAVSGPHLGDLDPLRQQVFRRTQLTGQGDRTGRRRPRPGVRPLRHWYDVERLAV